ncbi:hypothetical protein ACFVYE_36995 [Streptomyces sp. NPDC058239]|uniref:hypothetical protein n=1 Tax=Streptomyces sp. NPDC058239 TaxID=3346395 RepID=UPI0036EF9C23
MGRRYRALTHDCELFNAVKAAYGLRNSHPRCGWAVYLSENRTALVPGDLAVRRLATAHGGLVLGIGNSTEVVLAAQRTLAEAGALKPVPVSEARPKWWGSQWSSRLPWTAASWQLRVSWYVPPASPVPPVVRVRPVVPSASLVGGCCGPERRRCRWCACPGWWVTTILSDVCAPPVTTET